MAHPVCARISMSVPSRAGSVHRACRSPFKISRCVPFRGSGSISKKQRFDMHRGHMKGGWLWAVTLFGVGACNIVDVEPSVSSEDVGDAGADSASGGNAGGKSPSGFGGAVSRGGKGTQSG